MAERSEAKSVKRSFASKIKVQNILTRSFASRFKLRFAQPFLAKLKRSTYWQISQKGLMKFQNHVFVILKRLNYSPRAANNGWLKSLIEAEQEALLLKAFVFSEPQTGVAK